MRESNRSSANYSASVYPGLTDGAARLIESFGSKALYDAYVPKMRRGQWQGTMTSAKTVQFQKDKVLPNALTSR